MLLLFTNCKYQGDSNQKNLLLYKSIIKNRRIYLKNLNKIIEKYSDITKEVYVKKQKLNFFSKNTISIRLKTGGISYHSFITFDNIPIKFNVNKKYNKLIFGIYNPENSNLVYIIKLKNNKIKLKLFEKVISKKGFSYHTVNLKKNLKNYELEFETKGKNFGFWINPRLISKNNDKRLFIILVLDTMRFDHTSLSDYSRNLTPNLKKLAKDSVFYKNAFTTTSWTLPAHVSLFSGKDIYEHKVVIPKSRIDFKYPLLQEVFQIYGYNTFAITGGGFVEDEIGFYRGFSHYENAPGDLFNINSSEKVLNNFKNLIKRNKGGSFVFLHTYQIHSPYKAPHKYLDKINKNVKYNFIGVNKFLKKEKLYSKMDDDKKQTLIDLYDASILYADDILIGKLIDYLKQNKLYDNSMIVVLSDHGEEFYEHGSWEHGNSLYSELIRIPLVIKYPHSKKKGVEEKLTSISDIAYFILNETGFKEKKLFNTDFGRKDRILPVLLPYPPIISNYPSVISFIDSKYHFIYNIADKEKLKFFNPQPEIKKYELYSLKDKREKKNLKKELKRLMNKYLKLINKYKDILKFKSSKKIEKNLEKKLKSLGYLGN